MTSAPITPPVRRKLTPFEELSPQDQEAYKNVKLDPPQNFRDGHERKKKPYRADDPFRR